MLLPPVLLPPVLLLVVPPPPTGALTTLDREELPDPEDALEVIPAGTTSVSATTAIRSNGLTLPELAPLAVSSPSLQRG
jgi:hypothetical protein